MMTSPFRLCQLTVLALALAAIVSAACTATPAAPAPARAAVPAAAPAAADQPADPGWPRVFKAEGYEVVVDQPQIDAWEKYRTVRIRAAVVIRRAGAKDSEFGAVQASAEPFVDHVARTVVSGPRMLDEVNFP